MATKKSSAAPARAFFDIPLELIIVEGQIRSRIDQEGEEFLAHVESNDGLEKELKKGRKEVHHVHPDDHPDRSGT